MPNWAYTSYVIEGEPKELEALNAKLNELNGMPEPLVKNGFGNLWLGCIVTLLGGDWQKVYCRGRILDYYLENGVLNLQVESAWGEMNETRALFQSKHPELAIWYSTEESGMGIYRTNDKAGKYFPARYIVDTESDWQTHYDDINEATAQVRELTGREVAADVEAISTAIDEWMSEDPDNRWASFDTFDIVDD